MRSFKIAFAVICLLGAANLAIAATLEVSQPTQVTNDTYYERGQSIVYDGADYWLFYGRSATVTGPYSSQNPDVNDYATYYKKASSVPALASATAAAVPGATNGYLGETGAAYFGGEVWTFAPVDLTTQADVFGWYWNGATWTQVASMVTGLSTGSAHHDEIAFNGELFIMVRRGSDFFTTHSTTPKTGGWSTEVAVGSAGGLAHFYEEGGTLYLAVLKSPAPRENQIFQYNVGPDTWTLVDSAPSTGWDPTLFKVGGTYVFAQAPWTSEGGGRQYVIGWSGTTLGTLLSGGTPIDIVEGRYGANTWIDMWPIGFTDAGGTSYLFYTSERDVPSAEGTGNIWYLEVDWDVSGDHYTYIQEAIDAAGSGDVIDVAAGTYEEQVEIDLDMTLSGAGMGVTTIQSPVTMTKYFTTSANNYPVVYVHDAGAVTVNDLTVDGLGRGNTNTRFHGIAYRNAGGTVSSCEIKDIRDTPFSGAQHGVAMYVYNDDLASRSITVSDCVISGFQKNAMALNAGATTPLVVDVTGNTVTGAGATDVTAQNGIQVWADLGIGSVTGNTVTDVAYDNTANPTKYVASSFLNYYADVDFDDNVVADGHVGIYNIDGAGSLSGNTIDIVKVGVYAFGIIASDPPRAVPTPYEDFGSGAQSVSGRGIQWAPAALLNVDVSGNTVSFSGPDNTATYGIEADAGWGPNDMAVTANNNTVDGFEVGIEVYTCQSGCYAGVFTSVTAQYNDVSTSTLYGIRSNVSSIVTDGRYNYWGDATGPYHATLNPLGTGVPVSDYVLFNPWMVSTNEIAIEPTPVYTNCTTNTFVTFTIDQSGAPHQVRGYDVTFTVDGTYATVVGFTQEDYLLNVSSTAFYTVDNTGGSWTVSCAILGGTSGATGSGDLFTIELQPQGSNEGTSAISITSVQVRDPDNVFLPDGSVDGSLVLDCTVPTMEPIAEAEGGYYNVAPSFSNFGFDDDVALDAGEYKIDAGTWVTIFSGLGLPEYNDDGWTLPGFAGLSQGSHTVYFRVSDLAGNVNGEGTPDTYSWQFNKDTVPPAPPTNFVAMPGHEKTHLTWTNPTGDATWDGVEVRRARWYDYPQYSTPAPSYPADETEGGLVVQTSGTAHDDDPLVPPAHSRDIYYYSAFSYDLAGNYSVFDAGATDRATNYWLGDIDSTGTVATLDLVVFSGTYGESDGSPGFVPESDFGPSDDWSRFGIPLPDDIVQFEDLMIFAMNYGNVTPAGVSGRHLAERLEPLSEKVSFSFLPAGDSGNDGTVMVSIVINNDASVLKGMRLTIDYGAGNELVRVDKGSLLRKGSDTFLGTMGAESGRVYVDVAALGVERAFDESGEIARVIVRPRDDQPVTVKLVEADLRDVNNESDVVEESGSGDTFVPTVSALHQNHPNPFNPTTTLTYDVATPGAVSVRIYDVSGKLVRTLVDEFKTTGRYELSWDGRNNNGTTVTTGVYFYRMTAPGFASHTRKMLLLK